LKNSIFFSVVIPTYNSQSTILKTLQSVQKQVFKNFEIIIVDDGSLDNTVSLINNFISVNNIKIKLIKQHNSGGPASPRNLGIINAKGQWICFLDSDDYWFANKLNDVFLDLKHNKNIDVITSNEVMIYKKKIKKLVYGPFTKNFYLDLLKNGNKLSTSATCVNKNFLIEKNIFFIEDNIFSSVEDYDFWLQIAKNNGNFKFLKKFHGFYLLNEQSISKNRLIHFQNTRNVVNRHFSQLNKSSKNILMFYKIKIRICISFLFISIKEKNLKLFFQIINSLFSLKI
jgi:glycosyltransferase involved in cell wall biosynthesis